MKDKGSADLRIRAPEPLRKRLEVLAARERRSVNSQVLYILEQALPSAESAKAERPRTIAGHV